MSKLKIKTKERRFETARDLYGIFFEDINRAGDGGLYPEMLRNRSFEDSVLPVHPISGEKNYHTGVDIGMPEGTEILAGHMVLLITITAFGFTFSTRSITFFTCDVSK